MSNNAAVVSEQTVSFRHVGEVTLATVEEAQITPEVDESLQIYLRLLPREPGNRPRCILDLSKLRFLTSAGINTLLVLLQGLKERDGQLAVAGMTGHCLHVMKTAGLYRVFNLCPDVDNALEALGQPSAVRA